MKIESTNPSKILSLFPGWKKTLPYCTAGRPSYGSDEMELYEEEIKVPFEWYDQPAEVIFKRQVGNSTNYCWGMRDFGVITKIKIGEVTIHRDKYSESEMWHYGTKFISKQSAPNKAAIQRILKALHAGKKPVQTDKLFNTLIFQYEEKSETWYKLIAVADYGQDDFYYIGEVTPINNPYSTYYYIVHQSQIKP